MPLTARCKECKHILYDGPFNIKKGKRGVHLSRPNVPMQLINLHDGKCPNCGRKLEMPTWGSIKVLPAPGVDYIGRKKHESRQRNN